jgi:hypothetical protein
MRFGASAFEKAAELGHVDVLTWLRDVANCPMSPAVWDAAVNAAADSGDANAFDADHDVLKWLCVQPARPWDGKLVLFALREADEDLVEWAIANEPDAAAALRTRGCAEAIASGSMRSVKLARKHSGEWSAACTSALAKATSFSMVQFCVRNGCGVGEAVLNHILAADLACFIRGHPIP